MAIVSNNHKSIKYYFLYMQKKEKKFLNKKGTLISQA